MSAAPTSRPTFVIYRDEPPSPQKKRTVLASQPAVATVRLSIPTAGDKENLHPLTGLRPNSEVSISKKRKTGALATKKVVLLVKGLQSPPKKRKLSQSTAKSTADRKEKEGRGLSSRRHKTGSPSRVRKAPELPKVEEEAETEGQDEESQLMKNNMTQAAVDARCYELTVLPLADISKAYESCPLPESVHISEEESDVQQKKILHSDICNESSPPTVAAISKDAAPPSPIPAPKDLDIFSTPDRKKIYSAFTFSSPCATAERYSASRASRPDRFTDLDCESTASGGKSNS